MDGGNGEDLQPKDDIRSKAAESRDNCYFKFPSNAVHFQNSRNLQIGSCSRFLTQKLRPQTLDLTPWAQALPAWSYCQQESWHHRHPNRFISKGFRIEDFRFLCWLGGVERAGGLRRPIPRP